MGRQILFGAFSAMALVAAPANAALVQLCGPSVCYEYDDDPLVNAGITLFGDPSLLGGSDTLEFTPTNFSASSSDGGLDTETATFQFERVYTLSGAEIMGISVAESGDYRIINGGTVNANLRLQVVDQVNDDSTSGFPETIVVTESFNTSTPTGFAFEEWDLLGYVNPADAFTDHASEIDLQIQNTLDALTNESGDQAFIQKKLVLTVAVVPVPAAVWLFGSALGLLTWVRRRTY